MNLENQVPIERESIDPSATVPHADTLFNALSRVERRRILYALLEQPETTLDALTDVLAGWEATEDGAVGPVRWDRLNTKLVHTHLPFLADADLLEYDRDTGEIELADLAAPVTEQIEFARQYDQLARDRGE